MTDPRWRIDRVLATDLAEVIGWDPGDGIDALARRLPERVPTGSTAKLAAVAAGEVPPGADPEGLARRLVGELSGADGAVATPSWTCWVVSTVMAALVDTLGPGGARVAALRRIDDRSPAVDVHSAVVVPVDGATWVCDPYFGAVVAVEGPDTRDRPLDDRERPAAAHGAVRDGAGAATVTPEPGGRWTFDVRLRVWDRGLRYRVLGPTLDRDDVRALCAVSVDHSGAPSRPYARLNRRDGLDTVRVDEQDRAVTSHWTWAGADDRGEERATIHGSWDDAVDAFAARTGVHILS